MGKKLSS